MKNYIKGIITGIIIGTAIFSIPALADTIDALFNQVRISVNGVDEIQWDENITLADGAETPASILYNGTTYLPMRKLGELSGSKIYWNGDSRTVGMTGAQKDIKVIAEKPDKNGNVWTYYTFKDNDDKIYLGVKDENRGYERVYRLKSGTMNVTDNEIYFARFVNEDNNDVKLMRLVFDNDENSQDGEIVRNCGLTPYGGVLIEGNYLFRSGSTMGTGMHEHIIAENYMTNENAGYFTSTEQGYITEMEIEDSDENHFLIKCKTKTRGGDFSKYVTYDKTTNKFSE